jgi:putative lipoprotein
MWDKPTLVIIAMLLGLAGCSSTAVPPAGGTGSTAQVTGTVSYRERMALLPGVVIRVQLLDVSRVDAPATLIGEQTLKTDGRQVPLTFEIRYDPAVIKPQNSYAVRAWLEDAEGRMRYTTDQRYAVITRGAPTHVDLVMKGVGPGGPSLRL